jgi:hypothetical protein
LARISEWREQKPTLFCPCLISFYVLLTDQLNKPDSQSKVKTVVKTFNPIKTINKNDRAILTLML